MVKEEKEAARLRALKARKAFMEMLNEVVGLDDRSSFREMSEACSGDDRYEALGADREREDVFRDWQYAKASEMREKRRRERKGNLAEVRDKGERESEELHQPCAPARTHSPHPPSHAPHAPRPHSSALGARAQLEKALRALDPPLAGNVAWRDVEPRIASLQCAKDLEVVDKRDVFARVTREIRAKEAEEERAERKRLLDEERRKRNALRDVLRAKMETAELDEAAGCGRRLPPRSSLAVVGGRTAVSRRPVSHTSSSPRPSLTETRNALGEDNEALAAVLALTRGEELARAELRRAEDALAAARKAAEEGIRTMARRGSVLLDAETGWDAAAEKLKEVMETQEEAEARVGSPSQRIRSPSRRSSRSRSRSVATRGAGGGPSEGGAAAPRPWAEVLAERFSKPVLERAVRQVAATQAEEEERRKEQAAEAEERFMELLEDYYYRSEDLHVTWAEASRRLGKHSAFTDVENEADRERLFKVRVCVCVWRG